MIDSHVAVMSFSVVDEITCPSSTNMAALAEIFLTVAEIVPSEVVMLSVSSTDQASSQFLAECLELW